MTLVSIPAQANDAAIAMGERLFNDFRFSEYFHLRSQGNVNYELKVGAPELDSMDMYGTNVPSPFAGGAMSCASCHMVDQAFENSEGMRGYNDFSNRTKVPQRDGDKTIRTLRNTPTLVGIGSPYARNRLSHWDGEFFDHSETVLGNFTGRNMGWLKGEEKMALANIVNIIKNDKGLGDLAREFGGSYQRVFLGVDPSIPEEFRVQESDRLDVLSATDQEIIDKVIYYVTTYMNDLDFEKDGNGVYTGSMYDRFLKVNNLPRAPKAGQDVFDYTRDFLSALRQVQNPVFIKKERFENHNRSFGFGKKEWEGMKIFFNISKRGMCVNCHTPPLFTDQEFHNIGTTQMEYDKIHGAGSFMGLQLPTTLAGRGENFGGSTPSLAAPKDVDLGLWHFFGRKNKPELTHYMMDRFCSNNRCTKDELFPFLLARIKTPTLRNLGHSAPYFHNAFAMTLEESLQQYIDAAKLRQNGDLRNGAPQLRMMQIDAGDISPLKAFLESLNENYE